MIRLAGLLSLTLAATAPAADAGAAARDLPGFLALFEGEFDNFQQVFQEKEAKATELHEHIHSVFKKVDLPALGAHVFYVEQYMDGDPAKTYRQRLYTFSVNQTEGAIELKIWSLPDEKAAKGAHLDPSKLAGINAINAKPMPAGCEVYWTREGASDRFLGSMKKDACRIASARSGKTIIVSDDLVLDRDQIWIRDQAKDEQGGYVFGDKANVHHKLRRCHFCTLASGAKPCSMRR